MIIHNATFMIDKRREAEGISWLKTAVASMEEKKQLGTGRYPRLSAMREAGGVSHEQAEAASIAFQVEFDNVDQARLWNRGAFSELADDFSVRFGHDAMVFTSLFEVI